MPRKICVVTGTRADYGLLRWVMHDILREPTLQLQVVAAGMHLSPEFGLTYREIEQDGFSIHYRVEMLTSSDTPVGIAKSMGLGLIGFADAFDQLKPDLVVLLGDRFEALSAAAAATVARVPLAHIHGGELTEGAIDEAFRHAITKMSHLHFVAADEYRQRVIQLGEDPGRVFLVGGLGVDGIKRVKLLARSTLEKSMGFELGRRNLLVTFHPTTLEKATAEKQMNELLDALNRFPEAHLIFTMPNADTDGRVLAEAIRRYVRVRANARAYVSLGQLRYLSCLRLVDGVIGNSSSGLTEAPTFRIGTINLGDRQRGRLKAQSVIDCSPKSKAIQQALKQLWSTEFQSMLRHVRNPYGDGGASARIVRVLRRQNLNSLLKKTFRDLPGVLISGDAK